MGTGDIIGLPIALIVTTGILIWAFAFAKKMVKQYVDPLDRIANALEDIAQSLSEISNRRHDH